MTPNSLAADVKVSNPNAMIQIGQTFNININIDPLMMPVSGAQLNIKYNQSILKVNNVFEGNFFKQEGAKTYFHSGILNNSTGIVTNIFSVILGPSNVSRSGTFLIINATAIGSANLFWINLSDVKISDPNGISVSLKSINGTLNISKLKPYSATFSLAGVTGTWGVTVNGIRYTTSGLNIVVPGLSGTVSYSYDAVVNNGTDTRYSCTSGCTGTFGSSTSVSASYTKQYQLTTSASPSSGGTVSPSSGWFDNGSSVLIRASPALGYSFSAWSGSGTGNYSGALNSSTIIINSPITESAIFSIIPVTSSLAEALDNELVWTTGGNAKWSAQNTTSFYGNDAAVSGGISDYENTWIQTTVTGPGTLKFYWKVSSEKYYDSFWFFMDGMNAGYINGEVDWQQKSYNIGAGTHTLKWSYNKNSMTSGGMDRAWLDKVEFN